MAAENLKSDISSGSCVRICAACGAEPARLGARFCRICGKFLSDAYQPLDALRSSYKLQGKEFESVETPINETPNVTAKNENSLALWIKKILTNDQ